MKPIVVVGETNIDVVLHAEAVLPAPGKEVLADDCALTLGSASAICATGLARLGNPVVFVSRIGADHWGDCCLDALTASGMDTSHITRDAALRTGVTVSISSTSDRALITYVGSIACVTDGDVSDALLAQAGHLHVSSFFLQSRLRERCADLFARARRHGLSISLDPGFDPEERWDGGMASALRLVDVFLPNELELMAITRSGDTETALRALDGPAPVCTAVKMGRAGAIGRERGDTVHAPAFPITPVDTTGAGDSFNAGFLHAYLRGLPLGECLVSGNACGALSTRALGGTAGQPSGAELRAFIDDSRAAAS